MLHCGCVFCTTDASETLPMPALIIHPKRDFAAWVWVTGMHPLRMHLVSEDEHGTTTREFRHPANVLQYVASTMREESGEDYCSHHDLAYLRMVVKSSSAPDGVQDIRNVDQTLAEGRLPSIAGNGAGSRCVRGWPSVSSQPFLMRRQNTDAPGDADRPKKRVRGTSSPAQGAAAPAATLAPTEGTAGLGEEETSMTVSSLPPRADIPTSILALGGDARQILEIVSLRPVWDKEVIEEILRWGGRPKLVSIDGSHRTRHYTRVMCTFEDLSGTSVTNVWLPLSILKAKYARFVSHF